jgi:hypothetical protein
MENVAILNDKEHAVYCTKDKEDIAYAKRIHH